MAFPLVLGKNNMKYLSVHFYGQLLIGTFMVLTACQSPAPQEKVKPQPEADQIASTPTFNRHNFLNAFSNRNGSMAIADQQIGDYVRQIFQDSKGHL